MATSLSLRLTVIAMTQRCVDCDAPYPQWATVSYGTFMCLECSGRHRGLGVHISFVRSVTMDSWTDKQVQQMQVRTDASAFEQSQGLRMVEGRVMWAAELTIAYMRMPWTARRERQLPRSVRRCRRPDDALDQPEVQHAAGRSVSPAPDCARGRPRTDATPALGPKQRAAEQWRVVVVVVRELGRARRRGAQG